MLLKLVVIAVLALTATCLPANQEPPRTFTVCQTEECKRAAQIITSHIDESQDPCEDWYLYACGKFAEVNPLPENSQSINALGLISEGNRRKAESTMDDPILKNHSSKAVREMKKFYDECLEKPDEDFLVSLKLKNREYLLSLRKRMIEIARQVKIETFVPLKIPTVEEIMNMKLNKKEQCQMSVYAKYEFAFVRAWVDKFMNKSATAEARKVINNIHSAMLNRMNISWATEDDKNNYKEQLARLKRHLVYPDWIVDDKELDSEYDNDTQGCNKHKSWFMPILVVNAAFSTSNEIGE